MADPWTIFFFVSSTFSRTNYTAPSTLLSNTMVSASNIIASALNSFLLVWNCPAPFLHSGMQFSTVRGELWLLHSWLFFFKFLSLFWFLKLNVVSICVHILFLGDEIFYHSKTWVVAPLSIHLSLSHIFIIMFKIYFLIGAYNFI